MDRLGDRIGVHSSRPQTKPSKTQRFFNEALRPRDLSLISSVWSEVVAGMVIDTILVARLPQWGSIE
jgi:hypothetical protein